MRAAPLRSLKVIIPFYAVIPPALQTACLESGGRNRRGTGRCGRAFLREPSRRARPGRPVLHWFQTGSLCGACGLGKGWLVFMGVASFELDSLAI